MGRIQSNVGLITGIPITETINSLMQIEAQPRGLVNSRNQLLLAQRDAITDLTAKLLSVQFYAKKLATAELFQQHSVTSSNADVLGVRIASGAPVNGSYQFRPVQVAQKQQLLSSAFTSDTAPLGAGSFTFGHGGSIVSSGISLDALNSGQGIARGKIRITDRSGASAEIDLSTARTVDDVLKAVNTNTTINVTLSTDDEHFRLIDNTGQSTSNLKVQEISGGTTAASLGLSSINAAAASADGSNVFKLYGNISLSSLNDGLGVRFLDELADLKVTFRDGSSPLEVDFQQASKEAELSTGISTGVQGTSSQLVFSAKASGGDLDGLQVSFVNDNGVTAGSESVVFDAQAKTLVIHIDEGFTTTDNIIAAVAADPDANAALSVTKASEQYASGTTSAANGDTAALTFTSQSAASTYAGYAISFVDDAGITQGNETVVVDTDAKTIVFHIEEGATTAEDVVAAAAADETFTELFSVSVPTNYATTTTAAANGLDAEVTFTAIGTSADFNGVSIVFEDNPGINQGEETVAYSGGPPGGTLTFQIKAGETTANNIIAALAADGAVNTLFSAVLPDGSTGAGQIDIADTGTTDGGGNTGLITAADSAVTVSQAGLIDVDDRAFLSGGAAKEAKTELTLNDVIQTINEQGAGRLLAEISADGTRLQITDLTDNLGGSFTVTSLNGSSALADLGLATSAIGDTLTGQRLHSGLKSTLLRSLDGGSGLALGTLNITDRAGQSLSVDLSLAETLDDVIRTINDAAALEGADIEVGINATNQGLLITDSSGSTVSNLIIASGDAALTAEQLGLAVNAAVTTKDGGSLNRKSVTENTKLSDLNGGNGVAPGKFQIVNSSGSTRTITVGSNPDLTLGDLINTINGHNFSVEARINSAGDGLELVDRAGGANRLKVVAVSSNSTASDLRLLTDSTDETIDSTSVQVLSGSSSYSLALDSDDTLDDLISKFNDLGTGATASKFGNGSAGNPFRILFVGDRTGADANLTFDTTGLGFTIQETVHAQDAVLSFGGETGVLVSSATNTFSDVIPGVEVTVKAASATPITVTVQASNANLAKTLTDFTTVYNTLRDTYDKYTFFSETDQSSGLLFGSAEALRIDTDIANVLTGRFTGNGDVQSFAALGITMNGDSGKLQFDAAKLQTAFDSDPAAIEKFFTQESRGAGFQLDNIIESLVGADSSMLVNRARTLTARIDTNTERIAFFDLRLEKKREQLEKMFYNLELAIGKIQSNMSSINQIQYIPPV